MWNIAELARQTVMNFGPYDMMVRQILEQATSGASKKQIMERFCLSETQIGRIVAELQSKDLLRYHHTLKRLVTSAKGNIFLKSSGNKSSIVNAKDISRKIIAVDSNKSLLDARNTMLRYNISRIVVSLNGKASGVVTEKDIARILYETSPTKHLSEMSLKGLINKNLITIDENSSIDDCSKLMLKNNISSLIVLGSAGKDKGIITKSDLVELYAYHQHPLFPVYDCMQKKVHTVAPDETIHMIAMLMNVYDISRIVVKANRKPIGIVTTRDFLPISIRRETFALGKQWISPRLSTTSKKHEKFMPRGFMASVLAQDIMSYPPITVVGNANVSEAAMVMTRNKISGLPVINQKGNLVGIITKRDILKNKFEMINRLLLSIQDY